MVYVQTTKDVSCLLKGDNIELWNDDIIKVKDNDGNIVGLFDVGCVMFIYKTESRK